MTQRKDETREEYLARVRTYTAARRATPEGHAAHNEDARRYHTEHKDEISAKRKTEEFRENANTRLRTRYTEDPQYREKVKEKSREGNQTYREQRKKYLAAQLEANPEAFREVQRIRGARYRDKVRTETMAAYGGPRCACCGEDLDEFLCIDHIDGKGEKPRRPNGVRIGGPHFYTWLRANGYPPGYRVLCHNCNFAIGHYGACPHHNLDKESSPDNL